MRSCSALTRYCAFVTTLSKARPRSPYALETAAEGTRFGALVQDMIEGREPAEPETLDDSWDDFVEFRRQWRKIGAERAVCEFPMGLAKWGEYVPVVETKPHFYVPSQAPDGAPYYLPGAGPQEILATAGRLDIGWIRGNVATVLDLKRSAFKYGDPASVPQLMALGCMWAMANGMPYVQVGLYGKRDGVFDWASNIQRVSDVLPEVLEMASLPENEPRPGDWCQACYERRDCKPGSDLFPITKRR